jgi:hypothetical protein
MDKILYMALVILFLICFYKINLYFIRETGKRFLELKNEYRELKESREDLYNLLKDKEL